MKTPASVLLAVWSWCWVAALPAAEPPPPAAKNATALFDGKTLAGWEGKEALWRVQDGCLTGGSLTEMVKENDFLATIREYANFIVRLKIKLTGSDGFINSGFQIRSQRVPNNSEMAGYQCDYGDPSWYGCVYDESRRNKLMAQSDMKALNPVLKRNDWNDYVIRADGPRITTWINGVMGVDYYEADPAIVQTGRMGIQVHGGGKALVQVRDITIEELPPTLKVEGAPAPAKPANESPLPPAEEKAAFSVAPGLEMELVIAEDVDQGIGKFVAVHFDQTGRLWTMTALEYPVDANENPGAAEALYASKARDKVLVYDIEDRGANGPGGTRHRPSGGPPASATPAAAAAPRAPRFAKKPRVFADGLAIPLGILPYKDGCYVQHGHDLALLRDTDGDGRADHRDVVLTGFGVQDSHLFPHQFTRAPGGWIWMAQGAFNYSKVVGPEGRAVQFDQTRMARFRPDGSRFTITSNGPCNIWGLVMNAEGESFIQEANDFGYPVMPFHEYANYPGCSNAQWKSYAPEFPSTAPDFRMGGTGLSGLALTDVRGAFPPEWSDVMLVANPITNRIQAIKLHRDATTGTGWRLQLLPDVVVSGDPWFRPIALTLGPDGAVYIVDWYNKIISHNEVPRNHPERDKKRGRIWRLKGKAEKGFAVPDFTALSEMELVDKLGSESLAQSHLAWQTLEDRATLSDETIVALQNLAVTGRVGMASSDDPRVTRPIPKADAGQAPPSGAPPGGAALTAPASEPYPDAARIQASWALRYDPSVPPSSREPDPLAQESAEIQKGIYKLVLDLAQDKNRNVRREAARIWRDHARPLTAPTQAPRWLEATGWFLNDPDPGVRAQAIEALAPWVVDGGVEAMLSFAREPLAEPTAPSTQSGKPIKVGAAYEREFERYLVRMFLEPHPEPVAAFLDSPAAAALPAENLMVACLSLPARESAPRVAKFLSHLKRAPNDEEVLRLAEAPDDPAVKAALAGLIATPDGLQALLRQKTRFDARSLAPLLTEVGRTLLGKDLALGLKVISAFKLTSLEPELAALPPTVATLTGLRDLGSTRADLFLPLSKSADPLVRNAAIACLAATPETLLPLWSDLNAAQRVSSLDALSSTPAGAKALVSAVVAGVVARDELDGSLVEKLQVVLGADHAELKGLIDSMADLFAQVLVLNGDDAAWVDADLTLDGPFTVETWIKPDPRIGNEDGLLGAPGVLDINFYDSHLRVWAGGLHDVIVAKKATAPGAWTHVAVTRDAAGKFKLYLNGELDQAEGTPDPRRYDHLAIGRTNVPQGTGAAFAEYRVWNTCRTADEIRAVFDRTALAPSPALVFYRPLNAPWDRLHPPARVSRTMDFPALVTPEAAKALDEKFAHYRTLAEQPGDPVQGKVVAAVCLACHTVGREGGQIGPNLSSVGAMGLEAILRNILTPNAAMEPGYRVFRAELTDGSIKEGFLASRDDQALVIRLPGVEDQRIPADQVRKGSFTRRSLMPEGLEAAVTPAQWADLMAYLKSLR